MTIVPKCQVVPWDVTFFMSSSKMYSFPYIFIPRGMGVYMCKYEFVFVMPTYNPFNWLFGLRLCDVL